MPGSYTSLPRWLAEPNRHEDVENLVRHGGYKRLDGAREELGKGKRLAGVAAQRRRLSRIEVGKHDLEESQICPARKEAVVGQPESGPRQQGRERQYGDDADVDEGGLWDSEGDEAAKERDSMRRDELAEGDEEGDLEGNGAADDRKA